jgi:hypothetical protein
MKMWRRVSLVCVLSAAAALPVLAQGAQEEPTLPAPST